MNSLDTVGNIQVWQSSYLHCSSKYREVHDQEHNNGLLKAHNSEQYVCTHAVLNFPHKFRSSIDDPHV